jgi:hypothetical protein
MASLERRIVCARDRVARRVERPLCVGVERRASNDERVLKVVRELLAQSENAQKGELALRMQQVMRDVDMKRGADLDGLRRG